MKRGVSVQTAVIVLLLMVQSFSAHGQNMTATQLPILVSFVAPAYPRLASDTRASGTTVTHLRIGKDGRVIEAKTVYAHPFFAKYVLDALKQWRFAASAEEHEIDIICQFEFYAPEECEGADGKPPTPETIVSGTLPTQLLVRTTEKCWTITTSDPVEKAK